jgi:hypothetical protein
LRFPLKRCLTYHDLVRIHHIVALRPTRRWWTEVLYVRTIHQSAIDPRDNWKDADTYPEWRFLGDQLVERSHIVDGSGSLAHFVSKS